MLGLLSVSICLVSMFLIVLILIQRGKGGGLAGAFGGAGGQSAFGTKAGDMFTKVTAGTAFIWIVLCAATTWYMSHSDNNDLIGDDLGGQAAVEEGEAAIGAVDGEAAAAAADTPADAAADAPAGDTAADTSDAAAAADGNVGDFFDPDPGSFALEGDTPAESADGDGN